MSDLSKEIHDLLAERAIRDVIHRYARGIDRMDWELVRDQFHPDAVLEYSQRQTRDQFIDGAARGLAAYRLTQHAIMNVIIEVDGLKTAMTEVQFLAYLVQKKRPGQKVSLTYLRDGKTTAVQLEMPPGL